MHPSLFAHDCIIDSATIFFSSTNSDVPILVLIFEVATQNQLSKPQTKTPFFFLKRLVSYDARKLK